MLRKPIQSAAQSKVSSKTRPAPVMGLNSADPLTSMKDGYAIRAQNWVARTDGLHVRPGYVVLEDTGSDAINGVHFCGARRFSTTWASSPQAAMLARCTMPPMALPW